MKNFLGKQFARTAFYPFLFLLLIWIVYLVQLSSSFDFSKLGVLPRRSAGIPGILTSVFVHADLDHILSNSLPVFILGTMLFYFYRRIAKTAFMWIWLISGIWLWIGGRNNENFPVYHIGASTLIYGLATFLFFSGVFRKHLRLMGVSALVVFLYGSIMWGIFPFKTEMSWEGHLFGALAGVLVAFNYRKEGPQRKVYEWENEQDDENDPESFSENESPEITEQNESDVKINYIFKPNPFDKPKK